MVDALKANAASTADNRKKRTFKVSRFQLPLSDVVEVSGAESEEGSARKVSYDLKQHSKKKVDIKKPKVHLNYRQVRKLLVLRVKEKGREKFLK